MTTIRPPRWEAVPTTCSLWLLAATCTGMALAGIVEGTVLITVIGSIGAVPSTWAAFRAPRVGVGLDADRLRYRGWVVWWTVPREAITAVLVDAFVEWRDDSGTEHRRQIWMLTQAWEDDGTKFAPLWRWRRAALLEVRAWAGARAV